MNADLAVQARGQHAFQMLDAFRGLAAICVMFYHYAPFLRDGSVLGSSYLAVDLFFVLSGFVVAFAYEHRLRSGLGLRRFVAIRLIRLYPIYIAGSLIGLGFVVVRNLLEPSKYTALSYLFAAIGRTALFLPDTRNHDTLTGLFPFDQAAWSLSLEMGVNILYGVLFRWLSTRLIAVIVAFSAAALVATVCSYGTIDLGSTAPSLWGGVLRCLFGFFTGVLLFRAGTGGFVLPRHAPLAIIAVVLVVFAVNTHGDVRIVHDLVCGLLVVPLLVWLGGRQIAMPVTRTFFTRLALLSYPIYVFHTPVVWTLDWLASHAFGRRAELLMPYSGVAFGLAIIALSQLAVTLLDVPVRRWLTARLPVARPEVAAL